MAKEEAGAVEEEEGEGVEVREVEEEEWREELVVDAVERGNMRENLEMEEPELRLKTSVEVVEKETGEPSKMMQRKVMRPPLTLLLRKPLLILKLLLLRVSPKKKLELKTRSLLRRR